MAKQNMSELLKSRMASTKQASELAASDEAYEKIFCEAPPSTPAKIADLPIDLLDPFSTADIGFRPYSPQKLQAFAEQLQEEGFVEICVDYGKIVNKTIMRYIAKKCPPPTADRQQIFAAWREAVAIEEQRKYAPPKNITFSRKVFAPYLEKLGSDTELERMFLAFLQERVG